MHPTVARDMLRISSLVETHMPGLRSLILTGSFARDEGTLIRRSGQWIPYKDYDLVAVVSPGKHAAAAGAVARIRAMAYEVLGYDEYDERGPSAGGFHIGIEIIAENALSRLPHDLSNVELKQCGRVLWGENLLALIPADPHCIPPSSGLRPLLNKLIGLLEQWGPWVDTGRSPDPKIVATILYDRAKAVLDLVAAVLLVEGAWVAGYRPRNDALRTLEENGPLLPGLGLLADRADEALTFKLDPAFPDPQEGSAWWRQARDEVLAAVEPLAAAILGYAPDPSSESPRRFLRHARVRWLRPYARQALLHYGLPPSGWLADLTVLAYSAVENLRVGSRRVLAHPLVRAWAGAWAWLEASRMPEQALQLRAWSCRTSGARSEDPLGLRDGIVSLFKVSSTARRRKRTL